MKKDDVTLKEEILLSAFLSSPIMKGDFFMSKLTARTNHNIKKMVVLALFCAFAYVTMYVLRIKVSFLTFDAKDAVTAIAGLAFGPLASLTISLLVALLELITVSETGLYGRIMNFGSSAVFSCVIATIYKYKKDLIGAVVGLVCSVFAVTTTMLCMNLLVTPLFMKTNVQTVIALLPTLILPFNLTKAVLNASLVLVLYKPVSAVLKSAHVLPRSERDMANGHRFGNVWIWLVGVLLIAASIAVFWFVLGGKFELHR